MCGDIFRYAVGVITKTTKRKSDMTKRRHNDIGHRDQIG